MKRVERLSSSTAALLLLAALAAPLPAQEAAQEAAADAEKNAAAETDPFSGIDEADLFDTAAFDAVTTESATSEDTARIETLVGGTVAFQASSTSTSGFGGYAAFSTVAGKVFAKVSVPDYGALFLAYNASHSLFEGRGGDAAPRPASDAYAPSYSLSELHYSFDLSKRLFVRIGNQLIAWGPSRIWTPVDFINRQKVDSFGLVDTRAGKPGLRLHAPLPASNAFLFADFSGTGDEAGMVSDTVQAVNLGGRFDFVAGDAEFGLTGYGGMNSRIRAGFDFSGRLLGSTVYGEFAFSPEYSSFESSFQAALGFSRALGELKLWTLSAEGYYDSGGKDWSGYDAAEAMAGGLTPLYQGAYYAHAAVQANELFDPALSTTLSSTVNLSDSSYVVKLSESFSFPRSVPFTLSLAWNGGGKEKEFTRFAGDGTLSATISTRVEF